MLKIGVYLPVYGGWVVRSAKEEELTPTYSYIRSVALEAERIGLDSLWIPDHLLNPNKGARSPLLEAWTLAVAIATATRRVVISHTVLCEAFRHPAVLAKQAATLAEISDNRFWLSIGAGWYKREYQAYGVPFLDHDERVARAQEAIQLVKRLWQEETVNFEGKYYSVLDGILEPKPAPTPPIWYAGMTTASRRLAAMEADGWLMRCSTVDEVKRNIAQVNGYLAENGRGPMQFAMQALTFIGETDEAAREYVQEVISDNQETLNRTLEAGLIGSPQTVARRIRELEEAGLDHILLQLSPTLRELTKVEAMLHALR